MFVILKRLDNGFVCEEDEGTQRLWWYKKGKEESMLQNENS